MGCTRRMTGPTKIEQPQAHCKARHTHTHTHTEGTLRLQSAPQATKWPKLAGMTLKYANNYKSSPVGAQQLHITLVINQPIFIK